MTHNWHYMDDDGLIWTRRNIGGRLNLRKGTALDSYARSAYDLHRNGGLPQLKKKLGK